MVEALTAGLRRERLALKEAGRFHWIHWVALALSLGLTVLAWRLSADSIEAKSQAQFDREVDRVLDLVNERMRQYEEGLRVGVAAIKANGGDMTNEEWTMFADSLQIDVVYPGIDGIGVVHQVAPDRLDDYLNRQRSTRPDFEVHPVHDRSEYLPISYIVPAEVNVESIGLDLAGEDNRFQGLSAARDSGRSWITAPLVLAQNDGRSPGFLFFSPWYDTETLPATVEDRRNHFVGAVYAPFVVHHLMEGLLGPESRRVGITIRDGDRVLYDENHAGSAHYDPNAPFERNANLELYGRTWEFTIRNDLAFRAANGDVQPRIILIGGFVIDGILLLLFLLLVRSNRRASAFGDEVLAELTANHHRLLESNAELERFAYVASHDLQTPLRGISDLVEYLEEDLDEALPDDIDRGAVDHNLERLKQQTERMTDMIRGILHYSRIGSYPANGADAEAALFDLADLVDELTGDLGLRADQVVHRGVKMATVVNDVALCQVIQNLVANAVHHHDDPPRLTVTVTAKRIDGARLRIVVADNGPGIDPRYHDRIFELFKSLNVENRRTGIGLAIVKKTVEANGGDVALESEPGRGAAFTITWPDAAPNAGAETDDRAGESGSGGETGESGSERGTGPAGPGGGRRRLADV